MRGSPCAAKNLEKSYRRRRKRMKLEELYTKVVADEALKKAYMDAVREGKLAEFLKANGCEATEEELQAFLDSKQKKTGELADDELDSVAGGANQCGTPVPFNQPLTPEDMEELMKKSQEMMQPQTTES